MYVGTEGHGIVKPTYIVCWASVATNLLYCILLFPHVNEFTEHAVWPTAIDLAEPSEHRKLFIRYSHVILYTREGKRKERERDMERERERERERE